MPRPPGPLPSGHGADESLSRSGEEAGQNRATERGSTPMESAAGAPAPNHGGTPLGPSDDRRYPKRPMLGVGALIFDGDRILMAQRGKEPAKGWWSLPGGALETGELLADGIRREVREETGLEVEPGAVFQIFERIMRDSAGAAEYHYVLIDYVCRVTGGTLAAGDDVCRVEWMTLFDLAGLRITDGTLAVIEKAFLERR